MLLKVGRMIAGSDITPTPSIFGGSVEVVLLIGAFLRVPKMVGALPNSQNSAIRQIRAQNVGLP